MCDDDNFPSYLKYNGAGAPNGYDHVVIWMVEDFSAVAETRTCYYFEDGYKQPLITQTALNPDLTVIYSDREGYVLQREKHINNLIHELAHGFGFTRHDMRQNWIDWSRSSSNPLRYLNPLQYFTSNNGQTYETLTSPNIVQYLRSFHGCTSITGLRMDNDGDGSSHPDANFYPLETTVSGQKFGLRITNVTLAALSDSGWWDVDFNYAEPNFFGKGSTCNFISNTVIENNQDYDDW